MTLCPQDAASDVKMNAKKLARPVQIVVSLLLIAHLTVVLAAPLAMVTPASSLAVSIADLARPYLQAGNISHGYAFFAPDPGPSHLIRYELTYDDGRTEEGIFPDLDRHWPRLRYHRHFMLTEQLAMIAPPPDPRDPRLGENVEYLDEDVRQWQAAREQFLGQARAYADHLLKSSGAEQVKLHLIRHSIPTREDVLNGRRLDDESLYDAFRPDPLITASKEDAP